LGQKVVKIRQSVLQKKRKHSNGRVGEGRNQRPQGESPWVPPGEEEEKNQATAT